jgi:hypothetical protein
MLIARSSRVSCHLPCDIMILTSQIPKGLEQEVGKYPNQNFATHRASHVHWHVHVDVGSTVR